MDSNQLQELALNAKLNHWPPHLGVTTDAEKIEYLAARLREAVREGETIDELNEKIEDLEADSENLEDVIVDLKAEILDLKTQLREAKESAS